MTLVLPTKLQLGADVMLVPPGLETSTGARQDGPPWLGLVRAAPGIPCPRPRAGLVCCDPHPKPPGEQLGHPGGSADSVNSHFRRLGLSPAPCPPARHTADITRAPVHPPS